MIKKNRLLRTSLPSSLTKPLEQMDRYRQVFGVRSSIGVIYRSSTVSIDAHDPNSRSYKSFLRDVLGKGSAVRGVLLEASRP